jgi:hypothetical protein
VAAADATLRTWWDVLEERVEGEVATLTKDAWPSCEGPLLRAAFSTKAQAELAGQALRALRGDDGVLPEWARTLAERARTNDPDLLGVQVLATRVIPAQRAIALHEPADAGSPSPRAGERGRRRGGWKRRGST